MYQVASSQNAFTVLDDIVTQLCSFAWRANVIKKHNYAGYSFIKTATKAHVSRFIRTYKINLTPLIGSTYLIE